MKLSVKTKVETVKFLRVTNSKKCSSGEASVYSTAIIEYFPRNQLISDFEV